MADSTLPFVELSAGVGIGSPAPADWECVADRPLLVIVGVTGVGKSTALQALQDGGFDYDLLPDRRDLTDRLIIPSVQAARGEPLAPVRDRKLRFEYTRAYREQHAGGMAYALSQLWIDPEKLSGALLFDGLRGANEVIHAASLLPLALFVVLEAPDVVRVSRLMGRGDPFDQIGGEGAENAVLDHVQHFADIGAPQASEYFSHLEEQALLELVRTGAASAESLRDSLAIVIEERRNYDPTAASAALLDAAPLRTIIVDTQRNGPNYVAARITRFVQQYM
jgi:broad-specificity NMP kinase